MDTTFPPLQRTIAPATKSEPEEPVPDGIPDDNLPLGTGDSDLDFFLYNKGIYGW